MGSLGLQSEHTLVLLAIRGIVADQVLKEGADSGEPVVTTRDFVAPLRFQVHEEGLDRFDVRSVSCSLATSRRLLSAMNVKSSRNASR